MATQICPKCNEKSFTWYIEDEISEQTIWNCHKCNYHAYEDESHEKNCLICKNKTKSKLKDNKKDYWWCFTCKKLYYS